VSEGILGIPRLGEALRRAISMPQPINAGIRDAGQRDDD
jgi:hypothetical protein